MQDGEGAIEALPVALLLLLVEEEHVPPQKRGDMDPEGQ